MLRMPIGTFINMLAVILGSSLGLMFEQFMSAEIQTILFQAVGLGVLLMGIGLGLKIADSYLLLLIFALILGGIVGQLCHLDLLLEDAASRVKTAFQFADPRFTDGMVTAFMVFCVGSLTIVGAIDEGLTGNRKMLSVKAMIDGMVSIAFASSMGVGVMFSVIPMLIFQGGLTLLAGKVRRLFTEEIVSLISATGGVLIMAIALNVLEITEINAVNLMPALVLVVLLSVLRTKFMAVLDAKRG
ncbi:DUF554 domain-containing protein [Zhongshania sp.]|uniref:DUF554 domain-containing protein n=1 Tax=Zhongshania sp. TaxID=1971902 RepID=UPI003569A979